MKNALKFILIAITFIIGMVVVFALSSRTRRVEKPIEDVEEYYVLTTSGMRYVVVAKGVSGGVPFDYIKQEGDSLFLHIGNVRFPCEIADSDSIVVEFSDGILKGNFNLYNCKLDKGIITDTSGEVGLEVR